MIPNHQEINSYLSSPSSLNLSNKSLPACPPGVGRLEVRGHTSCSPAHRGALGGGRQGEEN